MVTVLFKKKLGKYFFLYIFFFKSINNWFNINILFKCDNFRNYSTFYLIYLFINKSKNFTMKSEPELVSNFNIIFINRVSILQIYTTPAPLKITINLTVEFFFKNLLFFKLSIS